MKRRSTWQWMVEQVARKRLRATRQSQNGQALVEFAFTFSIFTFILFGIIGMAIVFFAWLTTANAAREGTRWLVGNPSATDNEVKAQICNTTVALGMSTAACNANLSSGTLAITVEPATRTVDTQVSVTVAYRVPVPTLRATFLNGAGITFLGPITVTSVSVMRIN